MSIQEELASQAIARSVSEVLDKHYPGHAWAVQADVMQGIVKVHNLKLSGEWGFMLMMDDLMNDPTERPVVNAGGELLERFKLSRGRAQEDEIENLQRDMRGDALHGT